MSDTLSIKGNRKQVKEMLKNSPDFEASANEVTKLLKPIGGGNNG